MEALKASINKEGGIVPLSNYIKKNQIKPNALEAENFFYENTNAINSFFPTEELMEDNCQELKLLMCSLLKVPVGNELFVCYENNREQFPKAEFEFLIETVRCDYIKAVNIISDPDSLRTERQRHDESVRDFNDRFNQQLAIIYPFYGRRKTDKIWKGEPNLTQEEIILRTELFYIYCGNLISRIRNKIPDFKVADKCLKVAMEKAFNIETTINGIWKAFQLSKFLTATMKNRSKHMKFFDIQTSLDIANDKPVINRQEIELTVEHYNCETPGYYNKDRKRQRVICQNCGKLGHINKYCRSGRHRNYGNYKKRRIRRTIKRYERGNSTYNR
uniref:CCHC-type domain-containing protein n=1 Tax=Parastrongyloides trichosuri TaxID=131310 RepID=A0A0N4ZI27_PARTI